MVRPDAAGCFAFRGGWTMRSTQRTVPWQFLPRDAAMATMNISLADQPKQFVDEEVREAGYSSTSDYMRDLIRQRQRGKAEETLRALIAEGLASGPAEPVTRETLAKMRQELRQRVAREAGQVAPSSSARCRRRRVLACAARRPAAG